MLLSGQVYYTTPAKKSEGVKGFWCHSCYSEHRGEIIQMEGMRVRKVRHFQTQNGLQPLSLYYNSGQRCHTVLFQAT